MRSSRYQILPRAQYRESIGLWVVVWKDPGDLMQRRREPLRYVREYTGIGPTFEEAAAQCRTQYIQASHEKAAAERQRTMFVKEYPHATATSNLPWWRRLFRI